MPRKVSSADTVVQRSLALPHLSPFMSLWLLTKLVFFAFSAAVRVKLKRYSDREGGTQLICSYWLYCTMQHAFTAKRCEKCLAKFLKCLKTCSRANSFILQDTHTQYEAQLREEKWKGRWTMLSIKRNRIRCIFHKPLFSGALLRLYALNQKDKFSTSFGIRITAHIVSIVRTWVYLPFIKQWKCGYTGFINQYPQFHLT